MEAEIEGRRTQLKLKLKYLETHPNAQEVTQIQKEMANLNSLMRLYERVGIRGFQAIQKMRERRQPLTKEEMGIRENVIGSLSGEDIIEEIKCVDILQKKYFRYKLTERGKTCPISVNECRN